MIGLPGLAIRLPKEQIARVCFEGVGTFLSSGLMLRGLFFSILYRVIFLLSFRRVKTKTYLYGLGKCPGCTSSLRVVVVFLILCSYFIGFCMYDVVFDRWVKLNVWFDTLSFSTIFYCIRVLYCHLSKEITKYGMYVGFLPRIKDIKT